MRCDIVLAEAVTPFNLHCISVKMALGKLIYSLSYTGKTNLTINNILSYTNKLIERKTVFNSIGISNLDRSLIEAVS